MFCREWLAQLELHKEQIHEAGLKVVAVGLGKPQHAQRYCGKLAPSVTCYCDQEAQVYGTYGLQKAGVRQLFTADMGKAVVRALKRGHLQGKPTGDVKMLPGTFVVDKEGVVQYAHYSKNPGDHPDISALIRNRSAGGM